MTQAFMVKYSFYVEFGFMCSFMVTNQPEKVNRGTHKLPGAYTAHVEVIFHDGSQ